MGLGYVFIVDEKNIAAVMKELPQAFVCGEIVQAE